MPDRIPSDHESLTSHRVHLGTVGGTRRLQLPLPEALTCAPGETIFLSLGEHGTYSCLDKSMTGDPVIRGAYANRRLARDRDGDNEFRSWLRERDLTAGDVLVLDVLTAGFAYGLREPGTRVVYDPPREPDSSLSAIAESLDDE